MVRSNIMTEPNYPKIILSFIYRGCKIEIDRLKLDDRYVYAAWVNYDLGCAVAVPSAVTKIDAIKQAKRWIDAKFV
jgi:hypothetical protein